MTVENPNDSVQDEHIDSTDVDIDNKDEKKSIKEEKTEGDKPVSSDDSSTESNEKPDSSEELVEKSDLPLKEDNADETKPSSAEKQVKADREENSGDENPEDDQEQKEVTEPAEDLPDVDYSHRSRADLVETLELLVENRPPNEIREDVDKIKVLFYKKYKAEVDEIKAKFIADGGAEEDFSAPNDELENNMKKILATYRGRKNEHSKQFEIEKQENLKRKYEIIDKIKDLVNREESINKTFQEFRDLQNEWYTLGAVPQSSLKNLWETYNHNVEIFYDYIKINKELRDLDFKKNYELKIALCVKAEELLNDTNPVATFRTLQEYHQRWREIGPVPREERNSLWERFKEATSKINKRHHEYFEGQKEEQKKNLENKTALCEKIEEINKEVPKSFKEWETRAKEVIELQKVWRTIGFAPKKYNTSIYTRFREACDFFFQEKRKFYASNKEEQLKNLQIKTELCEKAEELQTSTDWKETTEAYIALQKKWKEVGSVPRKNSDKIWKRFRKACDAFFDAKSDHFSNVDNSYEANLKLKEAIIERLNSFDPGDDFDKAVDELKSIQEEWNSVGFVPFKKKDEIASNYRTALNKQFDKLNIDDDQKAIIKYKTKLDNLAENPKTSRKIRTERERFINKIKQLEGDIVLWENNIGFFSKSSNAEPMIKEVESKIEDAKKSIEILEEKVRIIDQSGLDD